MKCEFKVSKASEYESFKQIPKFNHVSMAVINPPPFKKEIDIWKPPNNLQFDGSKVPLEVIRYEPKNIPEHLLRPAIDENTLMKIREMGKSGSPDKTKKMSLGAQKEFKAE